jgi:hypothetical protein
MPSKNSFNNPGKDTSWLDKNLLLSLSIFLCTYTVLGWSISDDLQNSAKMLREQSLSLDIVIEEDIVLWVTKILAFSVIILISLLLTTPIALITLVFEKSLDSDVKAFIAILFWSIALIFLFCSFDYFAYLLVITSATILFRLDLQKSKLKSWQIFFLIFILATISFTLGMFLFNFLYSP